MAVERARAPSGQMVRRFASPANGAKRGVRLEWEGKKAEIDVPVLPFQTIETINESRQQLTLFSPPDDARPALPPGWKNKLIWGDKKLAMAALAEQYAGQVNLIYIDPPFDTGADFSIQLEVAGGGGVTKEPSIIERHAYLDTWGHDGNLDHYLQWLYETLLLIRVLLAENGSVYIHLDGHIGHYVKVVLDEVFGQLNFQNEIVWQRTGAHNDANRFGIVHDSIFYYTKGVEWTYNPIYTPYEQSYIEERFNSIEVGTNRRYWLNTMTAAGPGPARDFNGKTRIPPVGTHWRYSQDKIDDFIATGKIAFSSSGMPYVKQYLDESPGRPAQSVWSDLVPSKSGAERLGYPTQKPEPLLERIIKASSNAGDLILDCFIGSGTTAAAAERLGRRWIACDIGRFAIHTTRKRLIGWQGPNNERCRAFEVLNLGHYEQQFWQGVEGEDVDDITAKKREQNYLRTMLAFYHARPLDGSARVHGEKGGRAVHVGPLAESVSRIEAHEASEAALGLGFRGLDILGWKWDFESNETVKEDAKMRGVDIRLIQIPEEMLDGRARKLFQDGKLTFPELASLKATVEPVPDQARTYRIHLDDFIIPPATLPEALRDRVTRWQDYIDYWSVDWEYGTEPPPFERTFRNMWQDFRTRGKRMLTVTSENHTYAAPGAYTVMVKVVDIFGNDTTVSRPVVA